eukprot:evm.model.scf_554.6 EVM.evm.TU.scf_554.6   scf_554:74283-77515(+)
MSARLSTASCAVGRVWRPRLAPVAGRRCGLRCAAMAGSNPKYYLLHYTYVPDILERRDPFRAKHLEQAQQEVEKGRILLAGACGDPVDGAVFVFQDMSPEEIEEYVKRDPYVVNDLVPSW